jgi:hypothetical protein
MDAHLELESMGILRQTKTPDSLKWMNDDEKVFMLDLLMAGEAGLHKRDVDKFSKTHPETVLKLDIHHLAQWERDKNGRLMFYALTWQGVEAAELLRKIAQNQSRQTPRV